MPRLSKKTQDARQQRSVILHLALISVSILVAIILMQTGILDALAHSTKNLEIFSVIIAGMMFVSVFTVAPATVILVEMATVYPAWQVAAIAAFGGLIGDLLIFHFVKDGLTDDVRWIIHKSHLSRFAHALRTGMFRWVMPTIGALILVSPFPDELGLAVMGLTKMETLIFIPISYTLNFLSILSIIFFAELFF